MDKNADAFRTISEAAGELDLPQHVLRFWETRFPQIKPLKRAGGRRYYRPRDIELLRAIKQLLYREGYTIRGVQRVLKEQGSGAVAAMSDTADAGFPAIDSEPLLADERAGHSPRTAGSGSQTPAKPGAIADPDDDPSKSREGSLWAMVLTDEDARRLRTALTEMTECENILAAARRR